MNKHRSRSGRAAFLFLRVGDWQDQMKEITSELSEADELSLASIVQDELVNYEHQIGKYRAGEVDETKMQKLRLHFVTYAQRHEGVQMQRIKIPSGFLTADQLVPLDHYADR